MSVISFPFLYAADPTKGRPLFSGQVYVGVSDLDPIANPKQLNVIQEDGAVVPVSQPFVLGSGGVPVYNGKPVRLDVDGNYSIKILDKNGGQVYYVENAYDGEPITDTGLINNLNIPYEFDSVADMITGGAELPVGKRVGRYYYENGDAGYAGGVVKESNDGGLTSVDGDVIDGDYNVTLADGTVWIGDSNSRVRPEIYGVLENVDCSDILNHINTLGKFVDFTKDKVYVIGEVVQSSQAMYWNGNGAILKSNTQRVVGGFEVPFIGLVGNSNVRIRDFRFELNVPSKVYSGFAIQHILANDTIRTLASTEITTTATEANDIEISGCTFYGIGNYQFIAQGGLHKNIRYTKNISIGCIRGVALGRSESGSGEDVDFSHNYFLYNELDGALTNVVPLSLKVDGFYKGVKVAHNVQETTLSNSQNSAFPAYQFECGITDSSITNNHVFGSGADGGVYLTVGQADASNTRQAPCERITITGNTFDCYNLPLIAEMPKSLTVNGNYFKSDLSAVLITQINPNAEPWLSDANAQYWRDNYGSEPYPVKTTITGNTVDSIDTSNGSIKAILATGSDVTITGNNTTGGYTGISLSDNTINENQSVYNVQGNTINAAKVGIVAFGTLNKVKIDENNIEHGNQDGIRLVTNVSNFSVSNNNVVGEGISINCNATANNGVINSNLCDNPTVGTSISANNANCTDLLIATNFTSSTVSVGGAGANVNTANNFTF